MTTWFATLRPDMEIYEAIDVLENKRAAGAPVLDADGNLLGILTEKDCLRVTSNGAYQSLASGTVRDYMSEPKAIVTTDMDLFTVAKQFLDTNFAVLPVLENGKPVGRISRQDMLRGIQQLQRDMVREKAREEEQLRMQSRPMSIEDRQRLAGRVGPKHFAAVMREQLHR